MECNDMQTEYERSDQRDQRCFPQEMHGSVIRSRYAGGERGRDIGRYIERGVRKACRNVRLRTALLAVFALAWWGILYPELCFTEDTVWQVSVADGRTRKVGEADLKEIMEAAGDEIVIGSRLLEWLEERNWFRRGD